MIFIVGRYNELCNRLFTFANIIAFAKEHNHRVVNIAFGEEYRKWFRGTEKDALCRFPSVETSTVTWRKTIPYVFRLAILMMKFFHKYKIFPSIRIGGQGAFSFNDPELLNIVAKIHLSKISFFDGLYFIDRENFIKHADFIRDFFKPVREIECKVEAFISDMRNNHDIIIGVHIRHGDYEQFCNGLFYYTAEEYCSVMEQILEFFPEKKVAFLLCSNAHQDSSVFKNLPFYMGPGHYVEDLYALASCDYIIGPPSTFTQWASFYGHVPRYVINYKCEKFNGIPYKKPQINDFRVHLCGFGKYGEHPSY